MARCAHCGAQRATYGWTLQACADDRRKRRARLCGPCDERLNALVLEFFNVPAAAAKLEAYAERMRAESTP